MAKSTADSKTMVDRARASRGSKLHKSPIGSLLTRRERAEIIAILETENRNINLFPKK